MENNNQLQVIESPANLISMAIEKGASIEQLEKLLALKERWDAAQANKSFLSSMSNFQKDVPAIQKKKQVGYTSKAGVLVGYKYAELGEIDESIKASMAANGLSKRWEINEDGEKLICTCIISHVDGHTERTTMSSIKDASGGKNEIQSRASAISYLQRYTLIGALGLTTASEDNDGDGTPAASNQQQPQQSQHSEDNREWLTEEKFNDAIKKIESGEKGVFDIINTEYRMKKVYREQLLSCKPKQPKPITQQDDTPFEIPGLWFAKMEKCKTKAEVLDVYMKNKETVDAHPELQNLLKETQQKLSQPQAA